jgi:hypothetical protein
VFFFLNIPEVQPTYTMQRRSTICEQRKFGTDSGLTTPGMQPTFDPRT